MFSKGREITKNFYGEQNVGLSKDALRMLTYGL